MCICGFGGVHDSCFDRKPSPLAGLEKGLKRQLEMLRDEIAQARSAGLSWTAIGKMIGLTAEQIGDSRRGTAVDPKTETLIRFARKVVDTRGHVQAGDLNEVREAGFDDGAIAEVVAHVALNVLTNYFNNVAQTDLDFPRAETLKTESTASV